MGWFGYRLRIALGSVLSFIQRRRLRRRWQEDIYESGGDINESLSNAQNGGGFHKTTRHLIGPRASSDGIGWDDEHMAYMDENGVQMQVDYQITRRCDCGSLIAYGNSLVGTCRVCSKTVCKQEGCGARCEHCGVLVCKQHTVVTGKHILCSRHRWYGYWLCYWRGV